MRHFRIAAAALAAITLASCSDNLGGGKQPDNGPVSIAIKLDLPGISSKTRAIGAPVANDTKAEISSGYLFIYDAASKLIDKHIYIGSGTAPYAVDKTVSIADITNEAVPAEKDEVVISNVSASATNCMIVLNPPAGLFSTKLSSIEDVKKLAVTATNINLDATINCVTLTDDKVLTALSGTVPGFDGNGGATGTDQYTKYVELAATAIGTRIQLSKVTSEPTDDGNIIITAFNVRGVYINFYHTSIQLDGTTLSPAATVNNGSDEDVYLSTPSAYTSGEAAEKLANLGTWAATSVTSGASANPGGTDYWVYNLIPYVGVPHLLVNLDGIKFSTDGGTTVNDLASDKWLTVKGYNSAPSTPVTKFEKSNIYTIGGNGLVFDYNDLTDDPESVRASISATVTVTPWTDNAVTPVLE
jgi:hypothetical protein